MNRGFFIAFEGTEGSGKSTQIRALARYLKQCGRRVLLLREPGGTKVSEAIREILLNRKNHKMVPEAELLLYLAARTQVVREKILPALRKNYVVLCDRFEDSTLAYQGFGRGFSLSKIRDVSRVWVRGLTQPDLTILLDMDPVLGLKRGGRHDRMERQSLAFHRRVRSGFLRLAKKEPDRYLVLRAVRPKREITQEIIKRVGREFSHA